VLTLLASGSESASQLGRVADWFTVIFAPLGLVVAVAGFWIAIVQIRKTRTAARAAESAALRTSRALVQNHLLFLVPELQRVAGEIEAAVDANNPVRSRELLAHWAMSATRARGLLRARGEVPTDLGSAFSGAFRRVTEARAAIREDPGSLATASAPASKAIDKVLEGMGDLAGQMLGEAGNDGD
jgi:hypothetical protein